MERLSTSVPDEAEVRELGWYDQQTSLPGPLFWRHVLAIESARVLRYGRTTTLVLTEVVGSDGRDGMHAAADAELVIGHVARTLASGSRSSDYIARIAERRFALLLTETDEIAAINMVERVREQAHHVLSGSGARLAFGWASPRAGRSLVQAADTAGERLARELRDDDHPATFDGAGRR